MTEWSSFLGRDTHQDSNQIYFAFSDSSTNFYEFSKMGEFLEYLMKFKVSWPMGRIKSKSEQLNLSKIDSSTWS
jgi:hypothetical protein